MSRRLRILVVLVLVSMPFAIAVSSPAGAQNASVGTRIDQIGWWTSRAGATAGEGGFEVAAGIDGSTESLAAIQVTIESDTVDSLELTLTEAAASAADAGLIVCTTANGWTAAAGGALADAPEPDCTSSVAMTLDAGAGTWSADVAGLAASGGQVSLMILPAYAPATVIGPGMVVQIASAAAAATGPTPTTTPPPAPVTTAPTGSSAGPLPTTVVSPRPSTTPIPITPAPLAGDMSQSNLSPQTLPTPTTTVSADGDDEFFTLGPAQEFEGDRKPWERLVVLVPLSALIGVGAVEAKKRLSLRTA